MKITYKKRTSGCPFDIKPRSHRIGFTLLEMVIVLGIIAMIMGGAIFTMRKISDSGAITIVDGDFNQINNALQMHKMNARSYPTGQQGLKALVKKPNELKGRWAASMDRVPTDPWGNEYLYRYPGSRDRSRPELISKGQDGIEGTEDDMSSQDPR
jgi:general secretion pathway protein G